MLNRPTLHSDQVRDIAAHYEDLENLFAWPKQGAIFDCLKALQGAPAEQRATIEASIEAELGISLAEQRRLASQYDFLSEEHRHGACHLAAQTLHGSMLGLGGEPETIYQRGPLLDKLSAEGPQLEAYLKLGGYEAARKALKALAPEQIIHEVEVGQLNGHGGAYFPASIKWEVAAQAKAEHKFLLCNADEGEPPTRKDKLLLEGGPHLLLEGMLIAGKAIGARLGIIYVRGDYSESIEALERAIGEAHAAGWLGEDIQGSGFSFYVEVFAGSGSYVAGCDTAMIESLEGKAPIPRSTPPYPAEEGLAGYPTVVNNVETLCNVPLIIEQGGKAYAKTGLKHWSGTKLFSVSGDVAKPGFYEVPIGYPLTELLELAGGAVQQAGEDLETGQLQAVSPGGATAGLLSAEEAAKATLDPASMQEYGASLGSGAITVFNRERDMLAHAEEVLDFLAEESCGNCIQCPISIRKGQATLQSLRAGKASQGDIEGLKSDAAMLPVVLKCGLGKGAYGTLLTAVSKFTPSYAEVC